MRPLQLRLIRLSVLLCIGGAAESFSQLQVQFNGATIYAIDDNGVCTFQNRYTEESVNQITPGEIRFDYSDAGKLWSKEEAAGRRINFSGRFSANAMAALGGLTFNNPSAVAVASLSAEGDFNARGGFSEQLADPTVPGGYNFTSVAYRTLPLNLQVNPQYMDGTNDGYLIPIERRLNIVPFYDRIVGWPFTAVNIPLNGLLRIPTGSGPFPLALFVHGAHPSSEYSEPGYLYLCDLLASCGIIAGTIDMNFLNGGEGEVDARAIVFLEHIKQFKIWNEQPDHPLFGKVNMNNIMIVGHSRGGEAVSHASYFNTIDQVQPDPGGPIVPLNGTAGLGPYHFSLRCVFAFAPTASKYTPVDGPTVVRDNYFVIQGGRAWDVALFEGMITYLRAHPIEPMVRPVTARGFKSYSFVHMANHNFFNTVWPQDNNNNVKTLLPEEQQKIAKVYVASLAKALLLGDSRYLDIVRYHGNAGSWLPATTKYVSRFQEKQRLYYNHYEEDNNMSTTSPPVAGSNSFDPQLGVSELYFSGNQLNLTWNGTAGAYKTVFNSTLERGNFPCLAFTAMLNLNPLNEADQTQDMTVIVKDITGNTASLAASSVADMVYPDSYLRDCIPQSFRIPLLTLSNQGIDIDAIKEIDLLTNLRAKGSLMIDELQLSY